MSEPLKPLPLYELVRHIRGMVDSSQWDGDCMLCADELETQLNAWATNSQEWLVITDEYFRKSVLGIAPKGKP